MTIIVDAMRRHTWELIVRLNPTECQSLLYFLFGYLWDSTDIYDGVAKWIEGKNPPKEAERG